MKYDQDKKITTEEGLKLIDFDGKIMQIRQSGIGNQSPFEGGITSSQRSRNIKSIGFSKSSKWQELIQKKS